jgi:hypothetical protein
MLIAKRVRNDEQSRRIAEEHESVELVDANGTRLRFVARPFSQGDVALAQARAVHWLPRASSKE